MKSYSKKKQQPPKPKTVYVVTQEDANSSDPYQIIGVFTTEARAKKGIEQDFKDICCGDDEVLTWNGTSAYGDPDIQYDIQEINMYPGD